MLSKRSYRTSLSLISGNDNNWVTTTGTGVSLCLRLPLFVLCWCCTSRWLTLCARWVRFLGGDMERVGCKLWVGWCWQGLGPIDCYFVSSKRVSFKLWFHNIPALHEENRALHIPWKNNGREGRGVNRGWKLSFQWHWRGWMPIIWWVKSWLSSHDFTRYQHCTKKTVHCTCCAKPPYDIIMTRPLGRTWPDTSILYTNSFVTFLSLIYWLAFNAWPDTSRRIVIFNFSLVDVRRLKSL